MQHRTRLTSKLPPGHHGHQENAAQGTELVRKPNSVVHVVHDVVRLRVGIASVHALQHRFGNGIVIDPVVPVPPLVWVEWRLRWL